MQSYDLFMLLIVIATTLWGLWKGFAWQLASLTSVFSSYGVAYSLRAPVAKMIDADPPWNMFAAMLVVYILMSLASWVGFGLLSNTISGLKLRDFDRQLGGLMGAAKGAIVCVIVTFFAVTLSTPAKQQAICQSRSGHYIAIALKNSGGLIPPELHAVIDPYLSTLQNKLAEHQGDPQPQAFGGQPTQPHPESYNAGYVPSDYRQTYNGNYDPRYDPPQYHYQQPQYDPRYANPQYSPPQYQDPRYDPRYSDPRYQQPQPQYQQPQYANPPPGNGQPYVDPRYSGAAYTNDPRYADPRYSDPRYAPPATNQSAYGQQTYGGQGPIPASNQWR